MNFNNEDEVLALFSRLLERLQQADGNNPQGSNNTFVYVAPGAQYVKNLYQQQPPFPDSPQRKTTDGTGKATNPPFDADTPLTALFRENHHEELRKVINSWRPYLIDDDPTADALVLTRFEFDKDRIYSNKVYRDLCGLDVAGALKVPLIYLEWYLGILHLAEVNNAIVAVNQQVYLCAPLPVLLICPPCILTANDTADT